MNGAALKRVEKFKYLGVTFTSDGKQNEELDTQVGKTNTIMRALHYSVVMKRGLPIKAKHSIFITVFVPILTYGHESWVMTKRVRSQGGFCSAYLSSCRWTASDAKYWTICARFIATTTLWSEESASV